jgi:serine phosphatase RsbU (regulator of sigma subunit)
MNIAASDRAEKLLSLEEQVVRLQALLEASRQVHSIVSVKDVLTRTAQVLVRELEIDGALFLAPGSEEIQVSYGSPDSIAGARSSRFPLLARDGRILAELEVTPGGGAELSLYERDFIEGLALQAAVALENATYHERDLQWARVQQDLDAARGIQRSLLPKSMPHLPGFSIAGRSSACYEVGGDYMDTVALHDGSRLFIVADVAGKGLASAIMAMSFRSAFRSLSCQSISLVEMVNRAGQQHWEEGIEARRRYVTAIFLRVSPDNSQIEVVNAGHNPALLIDPSGAVTMIEASGTPLGMLPGMEYSPESFAFPAGSRVLLYTDGLTEVFHGDDEFGPDRLVDAFRAPAAPQAETILEHVWETLASFSLNAPQTDDMTAIALCRLLPQQEIALA